MEKFSDLTYTRPDAAALKASLGTAEEGMKNAASFEEQRRIYREAKKLLESWSTMNEIAYIRNTMDTQDPFYEQEINFLNEENPQVDLLEQRLSRMILDCPWRDDWAKEYGEFFLRDLEVKQKLSADCVVKDFVEESELSQQYARASAAASAEFRGETCNFYGLLKHMQSGDRAERREAMYVWGDLYAQIADGLDGIYDRLVAVRSRIAEKLGFDSYIDYIYLRNGHYDFNAEDIRRFRRQIKEEVVPLCRELRERQAKRLGVEKLHYYDEELIYPQGNPLPQGTTRELTLKAQQMYRELSPETGKFFDFMMEHELFDLETRPGKLPGGYCTFLPSCGAPFIFSNFNGTSADVDVLTHEAGHAFEAFTAYSSVPFSDMIFPTSEVAEIHSMTMEHFTYPWMELFFGDRAADYRYAHLMNALEVVPYMVCVDEFQHRVFGQPEMDAAGRRALWHELEETYLPWRDYDGHAFLSEGGFWMQKQHIFLYPFYYIDYAIAQMCAFQLYLRGKENWEEAWGDYYRLCRAGGSRGYRDLLKIAHLENPLEDGTVGKIMEGLRAELK